MTMEEQGVASLFLQGKPETPRGKKKGQKKKRAGLKKKNSHSLQVE